MPSYFYEVYFSNAAKLNANLNLLEPVYALYMYKKNAKVHILALPIIVQFIVASVQMERASRCLGFNPNCSKPGSLKDAGLTGCVFWYPSYLYFCDILLFRGTVVLAHTALWIATFAKRNVAEGRAVVVRLVVREGAWVVSTLIGQ